MKKTVWILFLLTALLLSACGGQAAELPPQTETTGPVIDLDLTQLSSTVVYSEVFMMLTEPEQYEGKTVRMSGGYSAFMDENTGAIYYVCMIADATACCAQGMEFILTDGNYPELESDITVVGTFQTYTENGTQYCHLVDAVLE